MTLHSLYSMNSGFTPSVSAQDAFRPSIECQSPVFWQLDSVSGVMDIKWKKKACKNQHRGEIMYLLLPFWRNVCNATELAVVPDS